MRPEEVMPSRVEQHRRSVEDVLTVSSSAEIGTGFHSGDESNHDVVDGVTRCQQSLSSEVIVVQGDVEENKSGRSAMTSCHGMHCRHVRLNNESMVVNGNRNSCGATCQRSSTYPNRTRCHSICVDSNWNCQTCCQPTHHDIVVYSHGVSSSPQRLDQRLHHVIRSGRGRAASWSAPSTRTDASFRSSDHHLRDGDVEFVLVSQPETEQCDRNTPNQNETNCPSNSLCRSVGTPCRINLGVVDVVTPTDPLHPQESAVSDAVESSSCVTDGCNRNSARPTPVDDCPLGCPAERCRRSRYPERCAAFFTSVRCVAVAVLAIGVVGVAAGVTLCLSSPEHILGYALFGTGTALAILVVFILKCWNDGREPFQQWLGLAVTSSPMSNNRGEPLRRSIRHHSALASTNISGSSRRLTPPWQFPPPPPRYEEVVRQYPPMYHHPLHQQQQLRLQQQDSHVQPSLTERPNLHSTFQGRTGSCSHQNDGVYYIQVVESTPPLTPPPPYRATPGHEVA